MKKLGYGILITIAITIVLGTVYTCMNVAWGDMCGNEIIQEIHSPNKKFKAVIFIRDCGATTGHSSQLSIIETTGKLENETGNTLIL